MTVIVPVWNGAATIRSCLESLDRQSFPRDRYEIIVVDNGSSDGTTEIVKTFAGIRLLVEPAAGSYRARNLGLAFARGKVIAFTDADCVADLHWLEKGYRNVLRHDGMGVLAGKVELFEVPDRESSRGVVVYEKIFAFQQAASAKAGRSVTANWMSPRHVFEKVGTFDGDLKSGGDFLLSAKIARAGFLVRYAPEVIVRHPTRGSFPELAQKHRRVLGGNCIRRGGRFTPLAMIGSTIVGALKKSKRVITQAGYTWTDRMQVLVVIWRMTASGVVELGRLQLGAKPKR